MLGFVGGKHDRNQYFCTNSVRTIIRDCHLPNFLSFPSLMGNSCSLVASCQERPSWGQIALSSADPAGNICHMAQLRTHETALPVSNSFSVDWIFPPSLSSAEKRRSDYGLRKSKYEESNEFVTSLLQRIWGYCKIEKKNCEEKKKSK